MRHRRDIFCQRCRRLWRCAAFADFAVNIHLHKNRQRFAERGARRRQLRGKGGAVHAMDIIKQPCDLCCFVALQPAEIMPNDRQTPAFCHLAARFLHIVFANVAHAAFGNMADIGGGKSFRRADNGDFGDIAPATLADGGDIFADGFCRAENAFLAGFHCKMGDMPPQVRGRKQQQGKTTMTEKANIKELLDFTAKNDISDLHISTGLPPMVRKSGEIEHFDQPPLEAEEVLAMIKELAIPEDFQRFEKTGDMDFAYQLGETARFRVNVFRQMRGPGLVCRTIPTKILSLEDLKTPSIFADITLYPRGLVLVTGPTGSGKSTTLAAMINEVNLTRSEHILTIEDPVEFVHKSQKALVNQREVGNSTESFASALRAALREDPDIILVGEMRDPETIGLALTAAETGHLVFGTLHTSSAAKTIDRVVDVFPEGEQAMVRAMLSESLRAVISQTLLKKVGGGRVAAHEIMIGTAPIRNLIREAKVPQMYSAIQTGKNDGMQTLDQCLKELVGQGIIEQSIAYRAAVNKKDFAD